MAEPLPPNPEPDSAISAAIGDSLEYLAANWQSQPSLEQLANRAGWSAPHYQRAFTQHVGVSPKRFLQFATLAHARSYLDNGVSLLETSLETGLSGPSRLHDLFVATEAMTPGEYKDLGAGLEITYGWAISPLGPVLLGTTDRGICWLAFADPDNPSSAEAQFHEEWSRATRLRNDEAIAKTAQTALSWLMPGGKKAKDSPPKLLLRGTNFQLKVWHALLRIPPGQVASYGELAASIGAPKATRAVGSACGANLISWLVPCHRAITSTGMIHAYRWGIGRKRLLLAQEFASNPAVTAAS
ncbi:MAG: methylated-DNA--[protein]-cysteine S-methyltransferase [Alphaproteobacteria bacterium]|nr:methylated-DNA--[protein]-cysteine S-methyltransferase [Alphaproteobacteria bacterium SS10]